MKAHDGLIHYRTDGISLVLVPELLGNCMTGRDDNLSPKPSLRPGNPNEPPGSAGTPRWHGRRRGWRTPSFERADATARERRSREREAFLGTTSLANRTRCMRKGKTSDHGAFISRVVGAIPVEGHPRDCRNRTSEMCSCGSLSVFPKSVLELQLSTLEPAPCLQAPRIARRAPAPFRHAPLQP
jgi:hypothetical protein